MKQTAILNVRVEPKIKKQAHKIAEELGFSLSSLVNGYLYNLIKTKQVYYPPEEPNEYLKNRIKQAEENYKNGKTISFKNPKDALAYIDSIIKP
jgi:antitoxin component of RelBE/YafQ-DinJ toxin-antitoxin module